MRNFRKTDCRGQKKLVQINAKTESAPPRVCQRQDFERIAPRYVATASLALSLQCAPVFAGPVADFEGSFGDVYANYRSALFATNSGDAEKSNAILNGLDSKWNGLLADYYLTPPPQYQDDPLWAETMDKVGSYLAKAKAEAGQGQLPKAHRTLEAAPDEIGNPHARNNVETFSDRMNACHAETEHVLELDLSTIDDAAKQKLLEHAAVLSCLAQDVLQAPPAKIGDRAEYDALANALQSSVDKLLAAARAGDADSLKAAVGGLKVPYSKFFLKFGQSCEDVAAGRVPTTLDRLRLGLFPPLP